MNSAPEALEERELQCGQHQYNRRPAPRGVGYVGPLNGQRFGKTGAVGNRSGRMARLRFALIHGLLFGADPFVVQSHTLGLATEARIRVVGKSPKWHNSHNLAVTGGGKALLGL